MNKYLKIVVMIIFFITGFVLQARLDCGKCKIENDTCISATSFPGQTDPCKAYCQIYQYQKTFCVPAGMLSSSD